MNLRALLGLALSSCLVACLAETTSLGGPETSKSNLAQEGADAGSPNAASSDDASVAGYCSWYSWMPVGTTDENQYLLPQNAPTNDAPGFIPANWDLDWVRVELLNDKRIGGYKASSADCLDEDGWYFTDGVDGATATRYSLCPKTSADVTAPEDFRLAARTCD